MQEVKITSTVSPKAKKTLLTVLQPNDQSKAIHKEFLKVQNDSVTMPTRIRQIINYSHYENLRKFGRKAIPTDQELIAWCSERTFQIASQRDDFNQDTPYVILYIDRNPSTNEDPFFMVCVTTRRLVTLAPPDSNIHGDDTHKLH